jgi:hypothetical protein
MADANSSTAEQKVIFGSFGLPRIEMPEKVVETVDGDLSFEIETHSGTIAVSSLYRGWVCRGSVSALAAGGLLRPEWVPGFPGNNKISQTVTFETDGPQLVSGNRRGKTLTAPYIVIRRASEHSYVVEVPPTKDQAALIKDARERGLARRHERLNRDRQLEAEAREKKFDHEKAMRDKAIPKSELRQECIGLVDSLHRLVLARVEFSSFRLDAGMARKMQGIVDDLKGCILHGELRPEYSEQGNIVPLHRAGAR